MLSSQISIKFLLFIVRKIATSHTVFLSHESLAWDTCWKHGSVRGSDAHFFGRWERQKEDPVRR